MGRSPCCEKVGLKKGPWTPEEDQKLLAYIEQHGHGSWRALPAKAELQRCGKSCRLRWTNYLRPDIKRGKFSLQEEQTIIQLHALLGNRWSAIATHLPKRTDNEIKNYWNTHLKKRLAKMGIDPLTHKPKNDALLSTNEGHSNNLSHMAQWESARLEAEARLVRQSKLHSSTSQIRSPNFLLMPFHCPTPQPAPPLCLDILKAGTGVCTKPAHGAGGSSSESTLSYSNNVVEFVGSSGTCENGIMKEEGEENWNEIGNSSHLMEYKDGIENGLNDVTTILSMESAWTHESLRVGDDNVHVPSGINFVEKFTDLLLNNSGTCDWNLSEEGNGESDNIYDHGSVPSGSDSGSGSGSDHYKANKNYWNSFF